MVESVLIPFLMFIVLTAIGIGIVASHKEQLELSDGEHIKVRVHSHWSTWLQPALIAIVLVCFALWSSLENMLYIALPIYLLVCIALIVKIVNYRFNHITLTDQRVIIGHRTPSSFSSYIDFPFGKIESIRVEYGVVDKILRRGTLIVKGTGGTPVPMKRISQPEYIHNQLKAYVHGISAPENQPELDFAHDIADLLRKQGYQVTERGRELRIQGLGKPPAIARCYLVSPSLNELQSLVGALVIMGMTRGYLVSGASNLPQEIIRVIPVLNTKGYDVKLINLDEVKRMAQNFGVHIRIGSQLV